MNLKYDSWYIYNSKTIYFFKYWKVLCFSYKQKYWWILWEFAKKYTLYLPKHYFPGILYYKNFKWSHFPGNLEKSLLTFIFIDIHFEQSKNSTYFLI